MFKRIAKIPGYFDHALFGIPYIGRGYTGGNRLGCYEVAKTISCEKDLALKVFRLRSWPKYKKWSMKWIEQQSPLYKDSPPYRVIKEYVGVDGEKLAKARWRAWVRTPDIPHVVMVGVYLGTEYLGSVRDVYDLMRRGVRPISCNVGFNLETNKWAGWSGRGYAEFGIGSKVDSEDHCCAGSGWTEEALDAVRRFDEEGISALDDLKDDDAQLREGILKGDIKDLRLPVGFEALTLEDAKMMAISFADSIG